MKSIKYPLNYFVNFIIALVVVAISSGVLILFRNIFTAPSIALLYLVPVIVSTTIGGRFAGITASVLSFLVLNFFFVPPYHTLRVQHPQDYVVMVVLLGVAMLVSSLIAQAQARLKQAQTREHEVIQLNELSKNLTEKRDEISIAEVLAEKIFTIFQASIIEFKIEKAETETILRTPDGLQVCLPDPTELPSREIDLISSHGYLGKIRIWGAKPDLSAEEERLLRTIVSQGALAFEKAILTEAENRAKILEESERLRAAILSSVSHELRTPLATIQASATSLFDPAVGLETSARQELQNLILEETENMAQLVGNLLNMSRIEVGALKLQCQWNSLDEILDISLNRLKRHLVNRKIEVDVSEALPLVSVDSVLMEQVFINLISNSIKFAPPDTAIQISAIKDDWNIKVSVGNQGPHIPEKHIEHVFEKFYPIPGRESFHGTGLGLSICKGIIEAHGGRIWAENHPVGVAFIFTIPLSSIGTRSVDPADGEM